MIKESRATISTPPVIYLFLSYLYFFVVADLKCQNAFGKGVNIFLALDVLHNNNLYLVTRVFAD